MNDTTLGAATGAMMHRRHVLGLGLGFTATIMLGSAVRGQQSTVKFWDSGLFAASTDGIVDKSRSFIYKAVEAYQAANPGETIEITQTTGDFSQASNQFRAASIAKNGPDMRTAFAGGGVLSFAQFLEPLDATFSPEEQALLTGWEMVRDGYKPDGSILALPYGAGSYFYVFYRPSMFQQAGVEFVEPKTWEEMLALGEKLKAGGVNPFWVCNQEGYTGAWAISALGGGQLGGDAFTQMVQKTLPINSPGLIDAYKAFAEPFARGLTNPDAGQVGNGEASGGFVQGRGAMTINGAWSNNELLTALGDDVGFFPIPPLASAKVPNILAGGPNVAVSVTNYAANKAAALKFLRFLAEAKTIDLYVETTQTEPSNHRDANPAVITNRMLREQAERLKSLVVAYPFDTVMPQPVIDLFYRVNATVFTGQQTAEDAVAQLQAEFDKQA